MKIEFACAACGKQYRVDASLAGKKAKCKSCNETMRVPVPVQKDAEPSLDDLSHLEDFVNAAPSAPATTASPVAPRSSGQHASRSTARVAAASVPTIQASQAPAAQVEEEPRDAIAEFWGKIFSVLKSGAGKAGQGAMATTPLANKFVPRSVWQWMLAVMVVALLLGLFSARIALVEYLPLAILGGVFILASVVWAVYNGFREGNKGLSGAMVGSPFVLLVVLNFIGKIISRSERAGMVSHGFGKIAITIVLCVMGLTFLIAVVSNPEVFKRQFKLFGVGLVAILFAFLMLIVNKDDVHAAAQASLPKAPDGLMTYHEIPIDVQFDGYDASWSLEGDVKDSVTESLDKSHTMFVRNPGWKIRIVASLSNETAEEHLSDKVMGPETQTVTVRVAQARFELIDSNGNIAYQSVKSGGKPYGRFATFEQEEGESAESAVQRKYWEQAKYAFANEPFPPILPVPPKPKAGDVKPRMTNANPPAGPRGQVVETMDGDDDAASDSPIPVQPIKPSVRKENRTTGSTPAVAEKPASDPKAWPGLKIEKPTEGEMNAAQALKSLQSGSEFDQIAAIHWLPFIERDRNLLGTIGQTLINLQQERLKDALDIPIYASALIDWHNEPTLNSLRAVLKPPSNEVHRRCAIRVLASLKDAKSLPLIVALADTDPTYVQPALYCYPKRQVELELRTAVEDRMTPKNKKGKYIDLLSQFGTKESLQFLEKIDADEPELSGLAQKASATIRKREGL